MSALYNEWESYPAAWLRNLIAAGELARGDVDERSICDLRATDLRGRVQFHAFAGIGGWGHALRLAGWPDDRPVWSASCPCQPFSDAGQGRGVDDERHLWPVVAELVRECRPAILFGEQVASRAGLEWFAAVRADMEGAGYAVGAADLCAAGVGAPHIRQRLYFVGVRLANGNGNGRGVERSGRLLDGIGPALGHDADRRGADDRLADRDGAGLAGRAVDGRDGGSGWPTAERGSGRDGRVADSASGGRGQGRLSSGATGHGPGPTDGGGLVDADREHAGRDGRGARRAEAAGERGGPRDGRDGDESRASSRARGPWDDAEWIACRDGKARPAQPGAFPLADGVSESLDGMRAEEYYAAQEVIAYAQISQADPRQVLRMVQQDLHARADREGSIAGVRGELHAPAVLLSFLLRIESALDATADGRRFAEASIKAHGTKVQRMRNGERSRRSSPRREPDEQRSVESPDTLPALSRLLARHAEAYAVAEGSSHAAANRVGKLRAYGNAIVPEVAAEFIRAVTPWIDAQAVRA